MLLSYAGCAQEPENYAALRSKMVRQQIEARGITDARVLAAMRNVERHLFVPPEIVKQAYGDHPLPIGYGQTISQPYVVAFMTEAVMLQRPAKVLEIGTGSGYQAAILGELCDSVFSIEIVPELGRKAAALLKSLGYKNIRVKVGDGYQGWPEHGPFQAIIVTCAPASVPAPLIEQLAEGGTMIIPVGEENQELVLLEKRNGKVSRKSVLPVKFVPMVNPRNVPY
jgi:protein-L-isoaspartate(D-aspartate) O-methyltransferase